MYQVHRQDILEWAKEYQGPKFHAMITDTPYHLTSITRRFGKDGSAPAKGDVYRRSSAGFMSQTWDGGGISFDPATWAALAEHLYPGAFGMSFASPRTHHRIACAIEDAGMIIQPTFYCWLYLSGFPKATRIKGEDDFNGHRYGGQCIKPAVEPVIIFQKPYEGRPVDSIVATGAGALNIEQARIRPTYQAQAFGASSYTPGGVLELLDVAYKRGLSVESCLDSLRRISFVLRSYSIDGIDPLHSGGAQDGKPTDRALYESLYNRLYPNGVWCGLNLLSALDSLGDCQPCHHLYDAPLHKVQEAALDGVASLGDALAYMCTALSEQLYTPCESSAHLSTRGNLALILTLVYILSSDLIVDIIPQLAPPRKTTKRTQFNGSTYQGRIDGSLKDTGFADSHPAGRWPANFILSHSPLDNGECHPDCPVRLFDEQAGETGQQIAGGYEPKAPKFNGRTYQNGEIYEGDKRQSREPLDAPGPASRMFYQADWAYEVAEQLANADPVRYEPKVSSSEREAGLDDLETRTRHRVNAGGLENEPRFAPTQVKNNHPCLKPISLVKYLCTLLAPPAAYAPRRILIPFAGSGSEIIGGILSGGFEEIIGIEREANYVKIAEARLAWWSQWPGWGQTDVDAILAAAKGDDTGETGQMSLFGKPA